MAKSKRNKKLEKLKAFVIYAIATVIYAILAIVPLGIVSFAWVLYVLKQIPLWAPIITTVILCINVGLLCVSDMGGDE